MKVWLWTTTSQKKLKDQLPFNFDWEEEFIKFGNKKKVNDEK